MALGKRCSVDNERKEDELMHETAKHEEVKTDIIPRTMSPAGIHRQVYKSEMDRPTEDGQTRAWCDHVSSRHGREASSNKKHLRDNFSAIELRDQISHDGEDHIC